MIEVLSPTAFPEHMRQGIFHDMKEVREWAARHKATEVWYYIVKCKPAILAAIRTEGGK